jgi:CTP:molybdopterin cytidylyltransferase MocA
MSTAAVILAAGAGSRFGGSPGEKLTAVAKGRAIVQWAIEPAVEAGLDELVVVIGAVDLIKLVPDDATVLRNNEWSQGQATSLGVALDWCHRQGHASAVVGLGDLPGLTAESWRRVADHPGGPIVIATYHHKRGHPVRLDSEVWTLLPTDGDEGARGLVARRPELAVEVACEGWIADIDTREDLRRWS